MCRGRLACSGRGMRWKSKTNTNGFLIVQMYFSCSSRAGKDGVAAADGVRSKRRRYPPYGGELVPLVFEPAGRPAEETVAWVRSWGLELDDADRSKVIRYAWQQYSTVLQSGNAEMILSAVG